MDPTAAFLQATDPELDDVERAEAAAALVVWLDRGGFHPDRAVTLDPVGLRVDRHPHYLVLESSRPDRRWALYHTDEDDDGRITFDPWRHQAHTAFMGLGGAPLTAAEAWLEAVERVGIERSTAARLGWTDPLSRRTNA